MTHFGLAYRSQLHADVLAAGPRLGCLEVTVDNFLPLTDARRRVLLELRNTGCSIVTHGLALSIGSVDPPPQAYLDGVARIVDLLGGRLHGDHLALRRAGGRDLGHFSPIWYVEESLEVVIRSVERVQRFLGLPFVLETIAKPFDVPGATMSEPEFLRRLCAVTGCGVLLDVTNVLINATNLGGSAEEFVTELEPQHVHQVHVAGYPPGEGRQIRDTHGAAVSDDVWRLYDLAARRCEPEFAVLERDTNYPPFGELVAEVDRMCAGARASR